MSSGIASEHEFVGPTKDEDQEHGDHYNPSEEERRAIRHVEKVFSRNKRWRAQYDKNWMNYYKMFRGQQWQEQRPSYRHSEVINLIFQAIQSDVPIVTDTRPRWEFLPQDPSDLEFAEIMNDMAEADWIKNNWLMELTAAVYDSRFYGTAFCEMGYDPKARPMEGDIFFESTDPFSIYPDPPSRDVNKRSRSFVKAEPVDISEIKREYPAMGKFVRADVVDALKSEKTELSPVYQLRLPIDETKSMRDSGHNMESLLDQKCLKKILYELCDDVEEIKDEMGMPTGEKRLKYPNGRKMVVAGGVLLEDGPLPYEDGKFPFARLLNYMLPREFWGQSEIEQLESPQKIFNKLISFSLDVLTLMGNPIWIVDDEAGIDTDNLINSPGMVVEKNKGGEVRREEGVQLQPYVLSLIDRMKEWFSGVSGVSEASPPPGVTAAAAIQDLQEAALTRSRLKSRMIDAFLQDAGQMYASRVMQYRDVPTVVRLTNNEGATKYFKFHIKAHMDELTGEQVMDERGNPVRSAIVQRLGPDGGYMEQKEIPIKGALDVKVSTGSTMPFMKARMERKAMDMFDRGAIDQEELLKSVEWPNHKAVLERMAQAAQLKAQAEQQAMAASEQQKAEQAAQAEEQKVMLKAASSQPQQI